ncbi:MULTISPECIES: hypothetical protein [Mesorhizobium]|nr:MULTISPECIES: hypothetical protein [Mesorhizobium]ETA72667.1 hypothetical protein MesloDRAFT_1547 [Mesorhizobium japonicum R7A]MBE1711168.1 hypothetical protein [Mesorhizobium japonicum]MBE1714661.1 hypothetical protein [Mesorhizobium japonicum]MUT22272.1 hypothetical protein [Mesorhizobium japonicum]MUT28307.1 hypothetical protein [Mesorhizobium japonicum]
MPRFSEFFQLGMTQHQLDFVDVSNEFDTAVYVDPFAIEIRDDLWAAEASEHVRVFFKEVLDALRDGDTARAEELMSHLTEPKETFLGVSQDSPQGRGVGRGQARQLISAIRNSKAYATGLLSDLSEVALYVDGIDRDKISDLTTNIIRQLLIDYTQEQCDLFEIETSRYQSPPMFSAEFKNWVSRPVLLPYLAGSPVMLVPKYIVRQKLSLNSQDFYNKQISDFLAAEAMRANSSLVRTIRGVRKVYKKDVHKAHPKTKSLLAELVLKHPELLNMYKDVAKNQRMAISFGDDDLNITTVCDMLSKEFNDVPPGRDNATRYHRLIIGTLTSLFYPDLIIPQKEWAINDGRKRIDIVYTNAADTGFFAHRRDSAKSNAQIVIVECKNYSDDIANAEFDQLIGRFDDNKGRFGIITCRSVADKLKLHRRCVDAAKSSQGYIIVLTDEDLVAMLVAKATLNDERVGHILHEKFQALLS